MHAWLFFLIKRYVYFPGLKIFQSNDINQNLQVTKWLHDIYYTLSIVYTFIFMWVYYILYICKFLLMLFYVLNFSTFLYSRFLFMLSLALQVIHLGNSKKHWRIKWLDWVLKTKYNFDRQQGISRDLAMGMCRICFGKL